MLSRILMLALLFVQQSAFAQVCPYLDLTNASVAAHEMSMQGEQPNGNNDACIGHCLARAEQSQQQKSSDVNPANSQPPLIPFVAFVRHLLSAPRQTVRLAIPVLDHSSPPLNVLYCSYQT